MPAPPDVMAQMLMEQGGAPGGPPPGAGGPPPGMGGPPPGGPGGPGGPGMPQAAPGPGASMNPMQAREFLNQLGISEAAIPLVAQAVQTLMMSTPPTGGPPGVPPIQGAM